MGREPQVLGLKGSKKWIQKLINENPAFLNQLISENFASCENTTIQWVSPIKEDDYAEYRDNAFLDIIDLKLDKYALSDFWPIGGPRWDALAKSADGNVFLVEAKSHIGELKSPATRSSGRSKKKIKQSLRETKNYMNAWTDADWSKTFFQYTNRIAHLYLLRVLNSIPAYLVFIYFLNDKEMKGPKSADEWLNRIELLHIHFGIKKNDLSQYIANIFIDIHLI